MEDREETTNHRESLAVRVRHFRKSGIYDWDGVGGSEKAEQWLQDVNWYFYLCQLTPKEKVPVIQHFLQGTAISWWRRLLRTKFVDQLPTWEDFEREFHFHYQSPVYRMTKRREFETLMQGQLSVTEYEARFTDLSEYYPEVANDEKLRADRFWMGLKPSLRTFFPSWINYADLVEIALKMEWSYDFATKDGDREPKKPREQDDHSERQQERSEDQSNGLRRDNRGSNKSLKKHLFCQKCGNLHSGKCYRDTGACLTCGATDHWKKDCPKLEKTPLLDVDSVSVIGGLCLVYLTLTRPGLRDGRFQPWPTQFTTDSLFLGFYDTESALSDRDSSTGRPSGTGSIVGFRCFVSLFWP